LLVALVGLYAPCVHAQTPNLIVSAGSTGQASSLTVTSDSQSPWKCFTVTGGSGQYNVIWAESTGTSGGIYFGTIATSSSGSAGPVTPPPAPNDLPIGTLTTAVSASLTAVDAATAATVANSYETIGKAIDAGTIVSPLQLQLATSAQLLSLTSDQLTACKGFIAAVTGWLDAQQCAARLTPDHMDRYAKAYHAIAAAIKPVTVTGVPPIGTPAASAKVPSPAEPKLAPPKPVVGNSPCANGQCPAPGSSQAQPAWFRRWRQ
jgi:hypothetical protein